MDENSLQYKGIKIFGFGSIVPMDLLGSLDSRQYKQYNDTENSEFKSNTIPNSEADTLSATPVNEQEMEKDNDSWRFQNSYDTKNLNGLRVTPEIDDRSSLDGSTRFPSSQNFTKMNSYESDIKRDTKKNQMSVGAINFNDADLINSIIMRAELSRVSFMGIADDILEENNDGK